MTDDCRLWAISDVHVDHAENRELLLGLDTSRYAGDCLIVAGDVTDRLPLLLDCLTRLRERFAAVTFVPGNHEMWLRRSPEFADSWSKFLALLDACDTAGVLTRPFRIGAASGPALWVVPLMSWYAGPEEDPARSLYREKRGSTRDLTAKMWGDFQFTRWPAQRGRTIADRFLDWNLQYLDLTYDAPVVSFSHFLPRQDLIFGHTARLPAHLRGDPTPAFNFTRVAGTTRLDDQVRHLGSRVHVYGHQHRNQARIVDGVTYVSHCMAYPRERARGYVAPAAREPRLIWSATTGFAV